MIQRYAYRNKKYIVLAFWTIIFGLLLLKAFLLTDITSNLEFLKTYKFVTTDSYDWVSDGILLFTSDQHRFRNIGLPLIIKVLFSINALWLLPFITNLTFGGILFVINLIARQILVKRWLGYLVVVLIFLNYSYQSFANYILSDYFAIFFIALATYWILIKRYNQSFFALGISAMFQNFAFFIFPVWLLMIYLENTSGKQWRLKTLMSEIKSSWKNYTIYSLCFMFLSLLWWGYKLAVTGDPLYTEVIQFGLLKPNLNSALFYLVNGFTILGPIVLLTLLFLAKNRTKIDKKITFLLLAGFITFIFWTVMYEWNDRRFLLYLTPFIFPLVGLFLEACRIKFKSKLITFIFSMILIYPTMISVGNFYIFNRLPITNWHYVEFTVEVDPDNNQGTINLPIDAKRSSHGILHLINPTFAESIRLSNYYKHIPDTSFSTYFPLVDEYYNSDRDKLEVCQRTKLSTYVLRSVFEIKNQRQMAEPLINYDC